MSGHRRHGIHRKGPCRRLDAEGQSSASSPVTSRIPQYRPERRHSRLSWPSGAPCPRRPWTGRHARGHLEAESIGAWRGPGAQGRIMDSRVQGEGTRCGCDGPSARQQSVSGGGDGRDHPCCGGSAVGYYARRGEICPKPRDRKRLYGEVCVWLEREMLPRRTPASERGPYRNRYWSWEGAGGVGKDHAGLPPGRRSGDGIGKQW